jgi:RNA polymerase sigma-70 factor (ECF subfamily)
VWFGQDSLEGGVASESAWESLPDLTISDPASQLDQTRAMTLLKSTLQTLPSRQREAFLLRAWEGLDVAQTAQAMGCSTGSVKTHCSRAIHTLRDHLAEYSDLINEK